MVRQTCNTCKRGGLAWHDMGYSGGNCENCEDKFLEKILKIITEESKIEIKVENKHSETIRHEDFWYGHWYCFKCKDGVLKLTREQYCKCGNSKPISLSLSSTCLLITNRLNLLPPQPLPKGSSVMHPSINWKCLTCNVLIFAKKTHCRKCKQPKGSSVMHPSINWKCLTCNVLIFAKKTHCRKCKQPKGSPAIPPSMDWKCLICKDDVLIFAKKTHCRKCKQPKGSPAIPPSMDWKCLICKDDILIFAKKTHCRKCKQPKGSIVAQ